MRFKASIRLSSILALSAVLLAGCGGGDEPAAGSQNAPPGSTSNAPPTIQGAPGTTVLVGRAYSFQPAASDPDGDALTFSVQNLPAWASFNASNGRITGTPSATHVGSYANIRITVTDGRASATLGAFSINVTETASGSATLSWTPPTQNLDGTTLTDLAGYEVRYGQDAGDLGTRVSLTNPSINTYVIENLTAGAWYFAVSAVNARGVTSPLSNTASKTIT
jgi:hypothetical protein